MRIKVKILRFVPYYISQSTTFLHMVIWMDIMSRDIKRVLYVILICVSTNFSLEKDHLLWASENFKSNHPYRRLRKTFNKEQEFDIALKPLNGDEVYKRKKTLMLSLERMKKVPLIKIFRKRGWCYLIFHIGLTSM